MSNIRNKDTLIMVLFVFLLSALHFLCDAAAYQNGKDGRERIELKLQQIEEAQQACGLGREDI